MSQGFPLALAKEGSTVHVTKLRGSSDMQRHLQSLGFVPGAAVSLVTQAAGQVIVLVKGARLGLNQETSRNVYVEE
ncbi:MAG: ferrous iron transport protein A [Coriobacteriia bacterium]|nr:ferrous iron transport protein A [Coriobacteriia bacterium]MBS5477493.1 ferrous iron transport protein A [Coriobacteriia bacterium]